MRHDLAKRLSDFLKSDKEGTFYVGHATVLARLNGKLVLVDPVFPKALFLDSWLFFPDLAISQDLLEKIDAVFISHCHEDHYDPPLLRGLMRGKPIYICENRMGFSEILEDKNLNVKTLKPFEKEDIFPGVSAIAIPSDHNDIDSSFVVQSSTFGFFQGNDNFFDAGSLQKAVQVAGKVHHAFIPFAYVWWYPFCLTSITAEQRVAEAKRLCSKNMAIGARMERAFQAELIVPSAANLVFYEDSHLNREIASPFDFLDYARDHEPDISSNCKALFSGDYSLRENGSSEVFSQLWSKNDYFAYLKEFLDARNATLPENPTRDSISLKEAERYQKKLTGMHLPKITKKLYFRRSDLANWALEVDMQDYSVRPVHEGMFSDNSLTFDIQPFAFEKWIAGDISLETVLNSQRFSVFRSPEVFEENVWTILRNHF